MAKKKKDYITAILDSKYTPVVFIVGILLLIIGLVAGQQFLSKRNADLISEDQILIRKGGQTVIVNKNGLVEYKSASGTFYRTWDAVSVSSFFDRMQRRARDYLASGATGQCDGCYEVMLYLDGKLVTIWVSDDDEDLGDVFEEFDNEDNGGGGTIISNLFNDSTTPTPTPVTGGSFTSPTPTGILPTSTTAPIQPTYTPQDNYPTIAAGCETWSSQIPGNKAIISNTYCTSEPTPTP